MLRSLHHYLFLELFIIPTETLRSFINNSPPLPQPLVTSNLFSVILNLPILRTSCKWNHTIFVSLGLACFTEHHVVKV